MKSSGETIALKIFYQRRRSPDESALLNKEAQILLGVKPHPNIVRFISICNSPKCYGLLMEFVSGGISLSFFPLWTEKLTDGKIASSSVVRLPWGWLIFIVIQLFILT
eukprot:m.164664 g.164664  ORF g.164664 m.164664 type:complete len:108 (+) comp38885_c0_seq15:1524-1847(+)